MKSHEIRIKRVYEALSPADGARFLVDRIWPRGIRKEVLAGTTWLKDVAPSTALRQWFNHEPDKWTNFRRRYRAELAKNGEAWAPLREAIEQSDVTLLYSAKNPELNQAVVLKEFLEENR